MGAMRNLSNGVLTTEDTGLTEEKRIYEFIVFKVFPVCSVLSVANYFSPAMSYY